MSFRMTLNTTCETKFDEYIHSGLHNACICSKIVTNDETSAQFRVGIEQKGIVLIWSRNTVKVGVFYVVFEEQTECAWSARQNIAPVRPCIFFHSSGRVVADVFTGLSMILSYRVLVKRCIFPLWGHCFGFLYVGLSINVASSRTVLMRRRDHIQASIELFGTDTWPLPPTRTKVEQSVSEDR